MQSKHTDDTYCADLGNDGRDGSQKAIEHLLDKQGYVFLKSPPGDFDYVPYLERLGPLLPQYDGKLVWSIKPELGQEDMYSSMNTRELHPHTEHTEFAGLPPKYLALWCLVPATGQGGQTMLGDVFAFLDTLTLSERSELSRREYEFASTPGLRSMEFGHSARHPLLELRRDLPDVARFSYACMMCHDDAFILGIRERLYEFVMRNQIAIDYSTGSLLIWDNYRMVHWRTAFEDRRRHLRRVWIGER